VGKISHWNITRRHSQLDSNRENRNVLRTTEGHYPPFLFLE
jgi:hypothetical protein